MLCINKEDGKCYIAGRKNICQCPEHIRLNVIENHTGQHIVNNINRYCFFISFGIAKGIVYRFFTGIVHPDDGCPCENSDCNRGQLRADMPIRHAEGNRCQRAGCRITLEIRACDNDGKRRNGADDERIQCNFTPAPYRLAHRMVCDCRCMRNDTVTGTCIIGINPTRHAVFHRISYRCAGKAAHSRRRRKCRFKHKRNRRRNLLDIQNDYAKPHQNIKHRHNRNRLAHNLRNSFQTAENRNNTGNTDDCHADEGCHAEGLLHGAGYCLCLYATGPGAKHEGKNRKHNGTPFPAKRVFHDEGTVADIFIHRVFVMLSIALTKNDFACLCRHPEKCGNPHPDKCARAAAYDCRCNAADIPRADRIRKPRTSRAEAGYRTHALACGGHIAEGIFYVKFQLSLIAEAKPKGQENARTQNDDNHGCSPEHVIHHIKKIYN